MLCATPAFRFCNGRFRDPAVTQDDESGDGGGARDGEQGTQEHGYHVPAPAAGLEGQADQGEAGEIEADEAPDVDSWGDGVADIDGRAPLQTSEVWGGAPAGRAPSKKMERLGNKHGLELDDRLAELLRCDAAPWFVRSAGAFCSPLSFVLNVGWRA